ncbi:hypothetical protein K523DRAFT_238909 [Schizophyllum commune Tattone D]|nr:hypothetical protein K523DRAFT_238909 [Schizophyllum commune Tattone D]
MAPDYLHALEKASRNDIYADDDEDTREAPAVADDSDALQERLKRMLHESLGFDLPDSARPKKKRKVSEAPQEQKDEMEFRLLSSHAPAAITLAPKPVTLSLDVREPEYEDTKVQAKERRRKAKAVAVDYASILEEASTPSKQPTSWARRVTTMHAITPGEETRMALLRHPQPHRSTRPPVSDDLLKHPPYSDGPALPDEPPKARCPIIDAVDAPTTPSRRRRTPRHRKDRPTRPPARFWSADGPATGKYRRDTMKKAEYAA